MGLLAEDRAYLFIVATTAPHSSGLHEAVEDLQRKRREEGKPALLFKVAIATWDLLCDHVRERDVLWVRYNASPVRGPRAGIRTADRSPGLDPRNADIGQVPLRRVPYLVAE